ncbi:MAG: type 2 isopentenyl-diphosphate Delta-isomerase [Candidatus Thermoplasmatota archaeon]|nr:type 2 isopentenyl-diphosphate Delta-isomerase [Euryarchaeota archaeon]MBU4032455.1 type 2 isopentenyl-diphosphate Delta-isomerase [Candidatus Thermoplasmatota archaeon]MBU4071568.1 type 2 isopentenyl-diphosphate Delta-isomerase [Candidatus Thermoplasmatota archaeon]MBU4144465.1 type 2 isopentenyl-diphosphate Delta-isomerase [Candidatus Thermoplasmatota archaeon]MBU4592303.1 type 2 isopentenyl-diphosphate Delta-isomerase [Candidatus Thermoplasmatota archaeon]
MKFERKADHIDICLNRDVNASRNHWEDIQLLHRALPEIDMGSIDTSVELFGKKLAAPVIISAITGGFDGAESINRNLAKAAAELGIGMGVGSQRPALEHPELASSYEVVKEYDVPLVIGNVGAPQLVEQKKRHAFGIDDCKRAMEMIDADILAIHLNFLQEIVQPEGDTNAAGCLEAMGKVAKQIPVLAKETGAGISRDMAQDLRMKGVKGIDVGGLGGTSFSAVEYHRAVGRNEETLSRLGETFWDWGIPTPLSILEADVGLPIIATGGLNTGLDVAKSISLGARAGGLSRKLLKPATESPEAVIKELEMIIAELKAAMFLVGASRIQALQDTPVIVTGHLSEWLNAMEPEE